MTRLLFFLLLAIILHSTMAVCPTTCVCIWKHGKETVECINRDLSSIPEGIEPSTQVLDVRGNTLQILPDDIFIQLEVTNLQKIFVQYCKIRTVGSEAFRKLTNLVELDLGENLIQDVPTGSWKHTKALMRLNLSGNPIKAIQSGSFNNLPFLLTLELSHCRIEAIMDGAFSGLDSLEWLKLEDNAITALAGEQLFPPTLKGIEIHNNPWLCDCRLLDFSRWVQLTAVSRLEEPTCQQPPRLQNRTVQSVGVRELACPPAVTPVVMHLQGEEGRNISLRCRVQGIPEASITWGQNSRLVANGTSLLHLWDSPLFQVSEFYSDTNTKVSELYILDIRQEDQGIYYCRGKNAAGSARANFTITVIQRKEVVSSLDNTTQESKQMFKVEYILGFGAAVVIVLTIIIVLILYIVLQCRQKRRERQLRKLICDSSHNSDSFTERSTVDYIVPGEMELMSAVRSVSCNSSMSKCNKTEDDEEYGPNAEGPPIIDTMFVKSPGDYPLPPPPPPINNLSCSNPDLIQDTQMWDRNVHKQGPVVDNYRGMNGNLPNGGTYAPHQYFPPRMVYPHQFPLQQPSPRLHFLPNTNFPHPLQMQGYMPGPPLYRHPPPAPGRNIRDLEDETINETVLSAANLNGAPMPHFYNPCDNMIWTQNGPYPQYLLATAYPPRQPPYEPQHQQSFEHHNKDCPRSRRNSGYGAGLNHRPEPYINKDPYLNPSQPPVSYHSQIGQLPPGHLTYLGGKDFTPPGVYQPPAYRNPPTHQWSAEEEERQYGPYSDGEADTMKKGAQSSRKTGRGRGSVSGAFPHYATMSRVAQANSQQSSLDSSTNGGPPTHHGGIKYTSQPQLNNSHLSDYLGQPPAKHNIRANSEALNPLSLKTSITFPRKPPPGLLPRPEQSSWNPHLGPFLRQDRVMRDPQGPGGLPQQYPDLARRPLSYSQVPPPQRSGPVVPLRYSMSARYSTQPPLMTSSLMQPGQTSSDDNPVEYEHSRSSSVGDIPVGISGPEARMATPDGYASLPYDSTLPSMKMPINGYAKRVQRQNCPIRAVNAVRVDLSFADKSIRRPGSAPDLVNDDSMHPSQRSPGGTSIRSANQAANLKDRGRSISSERNSGLKKLGIPGTPGTRKVAFAGIEDDSSTESDSSESDKDTVNSFEEEVWVKLPDKPNPLDAETVPTSGVVIAGTNIQQNGHAL